MDTQSISALSVNEQGGELLIAGDRFTAAFDTRTGVLSSLRYDGKEVIHNRLGLSLNWYRSVANDKFTDQMYYETTYQPSFSYILDASGKYVTVMTDIRATIQRERDKVVVPYFVKYVIYGNGAIDVDAGFFKPSNGDLIRRLGLQMVLPSGYENIQWYGRGPHENYADRKTSALFGRYETTVTGMEEEHYMRPQSMGNREDIRWFTMTDKQGSGIKITAKNKMCFSALHITDNDLWKTKHDFELDKVRRPEVFVNIDYIQQGLGNATCGPDPLPEYMIPENMPLNYSFRMEPVGE